MRDLILEALDIPPGWSVSRWYIARQLLTLLVEGLVFVGFVAAVLGAIVLLAAGTGRL